MTTTRTRRGLAMMAALLLVLTLVPAAMAQHHAEQGAEVSIIKAGVLAIHVDEHVHFGEVHPGTTTDPHTFHANYTNTAAEGNWSATVTATNFVRYEWHHPNGGDPYPIEFADDTISYTNLTIFPGVDFWARDEGNVIFETATAFAGEGTTSDPVTLFTAPDTVHSIHTPGQNDDGGQAAWLQLDVPLEIEFGDVDAWRVDYRATLHYTLTN